jgi:acyl-CoA thioester hydrolase
MIELSSGFVRPEWIDYNGHMSTPWYGAAFDAALDGFFESHGIGSRLIAERGCSFFAVEAHLTFRRELRSDQRFIIEALPVGRGARNFHLYVEMLAEPDRAVTTTQELLFVYVSLTTRRSLDLPTDLAQALDDLVARHRPHQPPVQLGRGIGAPRAG